MVVLVPMILYKVAKSEKPKMVGWTNGGCHEKSSNIWRVVPWYWDVTAFWSIWCCFFSLPTWRKFRVFSWQSSLSRVANDSCKLLSWTEIYLQLFIAFDKSFTVRIEENLRPFLQLLQRDHWTVHLVSGLRPVQLFFQAEELASEKCKSYCNAMQRLVRPSLSPYTVRASN